MYLKCEVLLLADVFKKFRNNNLKNNGLCPSLYLSATALSWDAILTMTKVELELISDPDMYIFFEKVREVGFLVFLKANSKYWKSYDPKQESQHIIYLDANNLYGYAMSYFLQTSSIKWIDPKEFKLNKYTNSSYKGCVLKVDLESKELQELHNDYPLAPYEIEIKREMLSDYQIMTADLYNIPIRAS